MHDIEWFDHVILCIAYALHKHTTSSFSTSTFSPPPSMLWETLTYFQHTQSIHLSLRQKMRFTQDDFNNSAMTNATNLSVSDYHHDKHLSNICNAHADTDQELIFNENSDWIFLCKLNWKHTLHICWTHVQINMLQLQVSNVISYLHKHQFQNKTNHTQLLL